MALVLLDLCLHTSSLPIRGVWRGGKGRTRRRGEGKGRERERGMGREGKREKLGEWRLGRWGERRSCKCVTL